MTNEPSFLSNIGLMLTYKCTVSCAHCIVKAGPHRKEEVLLEDAFYWLDQIKDYNKGNVQGIAFTGGEPFYNFDNLLKICNYANNLGFIVSVVTNAFWAKTKDDAVNMLNQLASLHMISISTDIPHLKFIDFENIINAVWAAKITGKVYNISVTTEDEQDPEYKKIVNKLLEITERDNIRTAITLPLGRGEKKKNDAYKMMENSCNSACTMASFPIIFPNGNVIGCIGPPITLPEFNPLYLGNLYHQSLQEILSNAQNNYTLHAIRVFGPIFLVQILKENNLDHLLPVNYIADSICDTCFKLFSKQETCEVISKLINQKKYTDKIAYGRYYYLKEAELIEPLLTN
jgi:MoaA/NifB/PqqE/SkfB family radical SAM enzyme